jgi:hypothetical protein
MASRHRSVLAFELLTLGGALYAIGLDVRAGVMRTIPVVNSSTNLLPSEDIQKLHNLLTTLDEKQFSLVDNQIPQLKTDPAMAEATRRKYQDLAANYKAMKALYANPSSPANAYSSKAQNLKAQHLRLVKTLRDDLKIEVPPKLLAVLESRPTVGQSPTMIVELVPSHIQSRVLRGRPGLVQRGPIGPRSPVPASPAQSAHERMQKNLRDRARDLRSRIGR